MRKPKSMWSLTGWIILILGAVFLLFGLLTQAGVMKRAPNSRGDPGVIFPILGCALFMVGAAALLLAILKEKRRELLLQTGTPVTGRIVSVDQLAFTTWGTSHPYVVRFTYEDGGIQYQGKSCLLWTPTAGKEDDAVTVLIEEENPKHCALKL